MADDPLELVGATLDGRFRVDVLVDDAGLNLSYRGFDLSSHVPVAVRCLNLPNTLDASLAGPFLESFHERTRRHAKLGAGHAVFVKLLASGSTKAKSGVEVPYEVREWLEATTLSAYLAKRPAKDGKSGSLDFVLAMLDPVADGLRYSHAMGVIHGAMSPSNLVVVEGGSRPTLRIVDFGDARSEATTSLRPVLRVLQPEYTAPEQVDKALGPIGPWTDVFALAVIVLECLAGSLGTDGKPASVLVEPEKRPSPKKLGLKLPSKVEEVLDRALAIDPHLRPADVATFWKELRAGSSSATAPAAATTVHTPGLLPAPPPYPKTSKPPLPARAAHSTPPLPARAGSSNPLVKSTMIGLQPQKLPLMAQPALPASLPPPPFPEDEAPTRPKDGVSEAPQSLGVPKSLPPPAPPLPSDPPPAPPFPTQAPASLEEPDYFVPALGPPPIHVRLKGLAVRGWELARSGSHKGRKWVVRRGVPWIIERAKDKRPVARLAFGGSTLGGVVFLCLCMTLCLRKSPAPVTPSSAMASMEPVPKTPGGSSPDPRAASTETPPGSTAASPNLPAPDIPQPPASNAAIEIPPVPEAPAQTAAPAPATPVVFTKAAATAALEAAGGDLSECRALGTVRGPGSVRVTFNKAGAVARIVIGPPYVDTPEGACILDRFGRAQMAPIRGTAGAVNYTFNLPR
jgi:eukaryotic-like serine/threonine-protein kinase